MPAARKKRPLPAFRVELPAGKLTAGKLTAIAGAAIIVAGTGWFYKRADGGEAATYRIATIQRGSVKATVSATGTLGAVQTIQVGTQVSGQIAAIYVDYNDHDRKGELLA